MYEIKKIVPTGLAKYFSLIVAIIVLIFGSINLVLNLMGGGYNLQMSWQEQLSGLFASIVFFYVFFWIIGYVFALIYNSIASKSKGIRVEFKLVDKNLLGKAENKKNKENKESKKVFDR